VTRVYIEPVESPFGRVINVVRTHATSEIYGQVARVRTSNLTVGPFVPRASGCEQNRPAD
jgi:hypothetical protein